MLKIVVSKLYSRCVPLAVIVYTRRLWSLIIVYRGYRLHVHWLGGIHILRRILERQVSDSDVTASEVAAVTGYVRFV